MRNIAIILFASAFSLAACGEKKADAPTPEKVTEAPSAAERAPDEAPDDIPPSDDAATEARPGAEPTDGHAAMGDVDAMGALFKEDPGAEELVAITRAVALMHPTKGSETRGTVKFEQTDEGLKVMAEIEGLAPGSKHAYHVHVWGDCTSEDGTSAGTHFHFMGSSLNPPEDIDHITGDFGNLEADDAGKATAELTVKEASLTGRYSILGRAVIVHEKPNDPTQPPIGAAGGRLACGVIGIDTAE